AALFGDDDADFESSESGHRLVGVCDQNDGEEFVTYIRRTADGTKIFVHTPANEEGVVQKVVEPDGTVVEHYLNGDKLTEFAVKSEGGLAWSLEAQDGSRIYEYVDGSRVIINSDGPTSFEYPDTYQNSTAA